MMITAASDVDSEADPDLKAWRTAFTADLPTERNILIHIWH